jgi:hypothetical protein
VVSATPGAQIDPGLSALAGKTVTVAAIPAGAASGQAPSLADFAQAAVVCASCSGRGGRAGRDAPTSPRGRLNLAPATARSFVQGGAQG